MMPLIRFYGHFAAAYGTLWLVMLLVAFISQSYIDTGLFGLLGFPIIALIYAIARTVMSVPLDASLLDPPPKGLAVPEGTVPCEPFECVECNHISRVVTEDRKCIHCGAVVPDIKPA
ncbi:MAG: hypothetical protein AAGI37_01035 [Planctomycetota bacterium]